MKVKRVFFGLAAIVLGAFGITYSVHRFIHSMGVDRSGCIIGFLICLLGVIAIANVLANFLARRR